MNKSHIIVAALAGMIAVTSCVVDSSEWNSTPWSLESYSIGLRCLSAEFPAVKMSEMLDFGTESMFGPGEHKTKMVLEQYGGKTEAELVTKYVADTTWSFTVTSGADGIFENMNAKGTISFRTLRKGVRDWQVEVSGTTKESTGYSSSYKSPVQMVYRIHNNDYKRKYEVDLSGEFETVFYRDGARFFVKSITYGNNETTEYHYDD